MMNSDEQWLMYLWSGVFASAVGGAVAVLVLWRTNRHQSKLAEEARKEARRDAVSLLNQQQSLAQGQIQAQRVALEKQLIEQSQLSERETKAAEERAESALEVQRAGLERQLAEQRRQNQRDKRTEALADLIASMSAMFDTPAIDAIQASAILLRGKGAIVRWRINGGSDTVAEGLERVMENSTWSLLALLDEEVPEAERLALSKQLLESIEDVMHILYVTASAEDPDGEGLEGMVFDTDTRRFIRPDHSQPSSSGASQSCQPDR